jgi:hypothetical protein
LPLQREFDLEDGMNLRLLLGGLKSYLRVRPTAYLGTGGTISGAYCYSVWLRHLSLIAKHLGRPIHPATVVELGPGDSIGLGIAALLGGAETYIGVDILMHTSTQNNLRVFDEIVALYRQRADVPDDDAFPRMYPRLSSYRFPEYLFDGDGPRLTETRLAHIRSAVSQPSASFGPVRYIVPWNADSVAPNSVDLIVSQGVLQDMDHTTRRDDLSVSIRAMTRWLKRGGVMSHQIDLSCPGGAQWNHHWAYGDLAWSIVRGNRPYYKNRVSLSEYIKLFEAAGNRCVGVERLVRDGLSRKATAARFQGLPDEDFSTAAALLVLAKD